MSNYFESIPQVVYKGPDCKDPLRSNIMIRKELFAGKR